MLQLHDQGARSTMRGGPVLDQDPRRGLVTAVNNNQSQMALRYALQVIADIDEKVDLLMAEREASQNTSAAKAPTPPPAADVKKKTPPSAKKEDGGSATG